MSWLSGWGKRIKLTIDHLKVDEDLVDFPLMIHLSNNSGRNDADVTDVFDELDYGVNDDFTGANGDSPDSALWTIAIGSPSITSNKLDVSVDSTKTRSRIASNYKLEGDFDIQIDFFTPSFQSINSWALDFTINGADGTNYKIRPEYTGSKHEYHAFRDGTQGYLLDGKVITTDSSGKLRITRTGDVFKGYYWNGSSWVQVGSGLIINDMGNCICSIKGECFDSYPTATLYADNFVVNSGTVVWPQKTFPNRKKLLITDDSGNPLYTEIDRWDQDRKKAYLWAKVPTVYSGSDTILYLYYDSSQLDNDNYIGDTGDLVAQDVWDDNFTAVYHMSQDPTGGAGCILDSTSNVNSGTPNGSMTSDDLVDGLMGKGLDFDGTDDYVDCGTSSSLNIDGDITIEAIVKNYSGTGGFTATKYQGGSAGWLFQAGDAGMSLGGRAGSGYQTVSASFASDTDWYHGVAQRDGSLWKVIKDAVVLNSATLGTGSWSTTDTLKLGNFDTNYVHAIIGEFRLSDIARSPAWVKSTYYSNFDNLIIFGSEELEPKYYYHGFVKEYNVAVDRILRLYNRNTGKLMDETTSRSSDGYYYLTTSVSGLHFIVAFDDDAGEDFNALILDKLLPRGME